MNESISKIIDKISDALNFFDFSFIVSGGLTFSIIYFTVDYLNISPLFFNTINTPLKIITCIGAIYICGLLSFAAGKNIRLAMLNLLNKERCFANIFKMTLKFIEKNGGNNSNEINSFINEEECILKLYYTSMWLKLRHCADAEATIKHLNRFWVMQAVFEGLYFSFILAIICCAILMSVNQNFSYCIYITLSGAFICYKEAQRYAETQINEIVIAYNKFILNGN